jgi:hypothetical protein
MAKWGFDLTDFGSDIKFKEILKKHNLKKYIKKKKIVHYNYGDAIGSTHWNKEEPYHEEYFHYEWHNPKKKLKIVTGNNPITGEYSSPKQRQKEKGYASYIGIEGSKKDVLKLKNEIKKLANFKDESPHRRDFI